jgi:lambda family phage portal protein
VSLFSTIAKNTRRWLGLPTYDAAGTGRRSRAWSPGNPGAIIALAETHAELLSKSRDLARRNVWAHAALEAYVSNAIGTGIKPQSMITDTPLRETIHRLWADWTLEADSAGLTDFYGLQALACRAMLEGGECLIRLRPRHPEMGLVVGLQLQLLEPEHLPITLNLTLDSGNVIRSGIEFDAAGQRVAYHLYRNHPEEGALAHLTLGLETIRVPAAEIVHLFRPLRPGQIRGEPWLARALVKLHELDQYDDAELVRKKTAAMFAGFVTRLSPEDQLLGEGEADHNGVALAGMEPGTMQVLEPGEDVKFSQPADVGANYTEFLRMQFRAVAAAMGVTYEQLTGDLSQVNYSSIRAGLLEFRRRVEAIQHGVIIHQLCRPIWRAWMTQAMLQGALPIGSLTNKARDLLAVKWIPQGWQWVDPQKEFNAMKIAIRSGLLSRSEAISAFGYDAEDIDQEIVNDNQRADQLGLVFDTDPRRDAERLRAQPVSTSSTAQPIDT